MTEGKQPLPDFDLWDLATTKNIIEVLAKARKQCPIAHSSRNGGYAADPRCFSRAAGISMAIERFFSTAAADAHELAIQQIAEASVSS